MTMTNLEMDWVREFDAELMRLHGVDHDDIGWDHGLLLRWSDIPAREAAQRLGDKYDLICVGKMTSRQSIKL